MTFKSYTYRLLILFAGLFLSTATALSQINISGTINSTTEVVSVTQPSCSDCSPTCKDTIEVDDATQFQIGDRALIIQMKGASINTTNTSSGGQITDIANAGNYEFFIIDTLLNGDLIIPEYTLIKDYDAAGQVQVVRIPNFGNATVTVTDTLTAPTWTESAGTGGVVGLIAKKLVLNADINVIGKGFKGTTMNVNGTPDNCSVNPTTAYTLNSTATQSYTKGEGIVANNNSFNRGRAPRANGGGSGISGDSGGGGGSSYGEGGMGGYRWCDELGSQDGGPDIPAGGLGGVALSSYFPEDKLFLGGAGGSGYVTTNNPSDATDGGGIVILFVDTLVGNGFSILADGTSPIAVNPVGAPDGGGGGGGGGSVLLNVLTITDSLTVSCDGGDGQDLNTTNYHGPGGGGGGGVLLYSLPSLPAYVTFSADGGVSGVHSNGYDNGAEDGEDGGTFGLYVPIENVNYRANVDGDPIAPVCDIDDDGDGIPDIQEIYSGDHDGDGILDWQDADFCLDVFDGVDGWSCATDGLPNPTADMDDDGYPNFFDADFPYCGNFVLGVDQICSAFDPDGDGIPSHLDLDSDNDGIPDIIEAGGADVDGNGQADDETDTDGDGLYDIYDNDDTDGPQGSSPCSVQPGCLDLNSYSTLPIYDTDNDTIPDFLDADSDNDGVPDVAEAGGADVNGDGRIDGFVDSDGDGLIDLIDAEICEDSVDIDTSNNLTYGTYSAGLSTGIGNGANSSGVPDGAFAQVYDTGDRLVLDFGSVFTAGTAYSLTWRRKASYGSGPTADMVIEESSNGSSWTTSATVPQDASQSFITSIVTSSVDTRYIRLRTQTGSNDDFDFDGAAIGSNLVTYDVYQVCFGFTPIFTTGADTDSDGQPNSLTYGDYDGDGIYDFRDLDSDNDGIPDVVEAGGTDADGDGIADGFIDEDGDGFNDLVDGDPTDTLAIGDDGVGTNTANALHITGADTDDDGRPNSVVSDDFDGDGIPNFLDRDSDGDGITDVIESGGSDSNNDGVINGTGTDTDSDGFADAVDGDVGNDGTAENTANALIATGADGNGDGRPDTYPNANFDSDTTYNALDIDSDNDGITDNIEGQTTAGYTAPSGSDTDGDGIDNAYDPNNGGSHVTPTDTDSDGDPDYLDQDSDDDSIPDVIEGHDMNGDGIADASSNANTGVGGTADVDADGLLDGFDNNTASTDATNGSLTPSSHPDVHNPGSDRDWRDSKDTDGDGIADFLDIDDDNDGLPDNVDAGGYDPDGNEDGDEFPNWLDTFDDGAGDGSSTDYTDSNGDGIPDVFDTDFDGIPNHLDKDSDNDGIVDVLEAGGTDANNDGEIDYPTPGDASSMVDADNDGLADALDNVDSGSGGGEVTSGTPLSNPDSDSDGLEDFVDIDADGDGIIDNIEAQATTQFPLQATASDTDVDGISNVFDPDNGGSYLTPVDTDGDGTPDYLDSDSDDDGVSDLIEGWDTDGDGTAETTPSGFDTDNDGLDNAFDDYNNSTPSATSNPSNNGQDAYDFPDTGLGSLERDWRDVPCGFSELRLAAVNKSSVTPDYCVDSTWRYYYIDVDSFDVLQPGDSSYLVMAIEHYPSGVGANSNDFTVEISITVSTNPLTSAGVYSAEDFGNEQATFVMGRYYNIEMLSGTLNGDVNVRFYYRQAESDTLFSTADAWNDANAGGTGIVSGLRWFTMDAGTFDPGTADLIAAGIQGATQVFPSTGTEDGLLYAEFTLSDLTGGGLAYTVGEASIILPVELLSFDASVTKERTVRLDWTTATEINSDRFEIERSSNLVDWMVIAEVPAAGNSSKKIDYQTFDERPLLGTSYYRLVEIDHDGSSDISDVRTVQMSSESFEDLNISVFPNPNDGSFKISLEGDASSAQLELKSATGQAIKSWTAEQIRANKQAIRVNGLAKGAYFLVLRQNERVMTTKVIVH